MNNKRELMDRETQIAKDVDMVYLVKAFGYTPIKRGKTHILREHDSFVIFNDTNTFYHYSQRQGGSPIDFCMMYGNMTTKDAIHYLLDMAGKHHEEIESYTYKAKKVKKQEYNLADELPEANDNYKRVFAYLNKTRGISGKVISYFMHNKMLYESKEHHNCVFVTRDENGTPKYASMRGTLTNQNIFKGDVKGSNKEYGYGVYNPGSDKVIVFEAPIDLMSFLTLYPDNECSLHALGCLGINSLISFLGKHPDVKRITFILDNDIHAIEATQEFKMFLSEQGFTIEEHEISRIMSDVGINDINDYLVMKNASREQEKKNKIL